MLNNYKNIDFLSGECLLKGRLYLGKDFKLLPFIIMTHGTSATITMGINYYASAFQQAGFNVLLYDHEGIGSSDGKPQSINPWIQARGYKNAYKYLKYNKYLHNNKVFLWGESFSGMLVLVVGALIKNITGIISVTPSCGSEIIKFKNKNKNFITLKNIFHKALIDRFEADVIGPIAVVSNNQDKHTSLLKPKEAYDWFMTFGNTKNSKWKNIITRITPKTKVAFSPQLTAPFIKSPTLMITAENDEIEQANPIVQKKVFEDILVDKILIKINGGHFGCLYPNSNIFKTNLKHQLILLNKFK